jgi:hypothetical protein
LYPLKEHNQLLKTEHAAESVETENGIHVVQYAKTIVSHLGQYVGLYGGKQQSNNTEHAFIISDQVLKEVKRAVKQMLINPSDELKSDQLYHGSLIAFYEDVLKKRAGLFAINGTTYEDLLQIFVSMMHSRLRQEANSKSGSDAEADEFIYARVQKLAKVIKSAVEEMCSAEDLNRMQRRMSRVAIQRLVAAGMETSQDQYPDECTKRRRRATSVHSSHPELNKDVDQNEIAESAASRTMSEWLKQAFSGNREQHLALVREIKQSRAPECLEVEYKLRLKILDNDAKKLDDPSTPMLQTFYGINPESFENKETYIYWRKLEKNALLEKTNQLHVRYIDSLEQQQKATEVALPEVKKEAEVLIEAQATKQSKPSRIKICIHLVEARNVAIKDDTGTSDPYCVVEYGDKQRYETNIIYKSLSPRWNQDVML